MFYVACVPHQGMARESYVLYTDNTARYGRVNSVVNARDLCARCEGTWTYKNGRFCRCRETVYQYWEIKMISRYCKKPIWIYWCRKLFADIGNYFPISVIISVNREILDKCPFDVPAPLYWHGLTLIPTWIRNHMPGKMWDGTADTFPNSKGVDRWDSEMDK